MLRRVPVILMILLLSVSCASTEGVQYTKEEIRDALVSLSGDMLFSVDLEDGIGAESIISALPLTYSAYSRYVPLYEDVAMEYAEEISLLISPLLPLALPVIEEAASGTAMSGSSQYIHDDKAFTEGVRAVSYDDVVSCYREALSSMEDELEKAFQPSRSLFMSVRAAYLNLASVGHAIYISEPDMIDPDSAAVILADTLFSRLGDRESYLKNTPLGSSSDSYYVFWGGR